MMTPEQYNKFVEDINNEPTPDFVSQMRVTNRIRDAIKNRAMYPEEGFESWINHLLDDIDGGIYEFSYERIKTDNPNIDTVKKTHKKEFVSEEYVKSLEKRIEELEAFNHGLIADKLLMEKRIRALESTMTELVMPKLK